MPEDVVLEGLFCRWRVDDEDFVVGVTTEWRAVGDSAFIHIAVARLVAECVGLFCAFFVDFVDARIEAARDE